MLTANERARLSWPDNHSELNFIGFDSEGNHITKGDEVKVLIEEQYRNAPAYAFCSTGKKGKALEQIGGPVSYLVSVEFEKESGGKETVSCIDFHLKKVA